MLKKRNAQVFSIYTIIVVVLGMIILAGIVLMLTGRFGDFSEGADTGECKGKNLWHKLGFGDDCDASKLNDGGNGNDPTDPSAFDPDKLFG